jgi:hypothetical protein
MESGRGGKALSIRLEVSALVSTRGPGRAVGKCGLRC